MHKHIAIFEVPGGSDKGTDGHRADTMPIVEALRALGWGAEVIFYSDDCVEEIFETVVSSCDGYVPRVNPGSIPEGDEKFHGLLERLSAAGLIGMTHPDTMASFGTKASLTTLTDTWLVPDDTYAYYLLDELRDGLSKSLSYRSRVLKQNRGSTGKGIWRVELLDPRSAEPGVSVPLDAQVRCTEAVDNHCEVYSLGDFVKFCERYLTGDGGLVVDMRFMPRISEGEIRLVFVGSRPVAVIRKVPAMAEGAFSATLFSGADYSYHDPSDYADLVSRFEDVLPVVAVRLGGGGPLPLLWTADFMADWGPSGEDAHVLGEMNCSCVGFTSELDRGIQDKVALEIILRVSEAATGLRHGASVEISPREPLVLA
jgi:hypothetical protein